MAIYFQVESKLKDISSLLEYSISILIGTFFIFTGFGKLLNVNELIIGIMRYGISYKLAPLAVFLPTIEILLGLLFYFPKTRKLAGIIAFILLLFFSAVYIYGYFTRDISDCGCFGVISFLDDSPFIVLAQNLFFLAGITWLINRNYYKSPVLSGWQRILVFMVAIVAATASGASSVRPLYEKTHPWIGKPIQETPLVQLTTISKNSTYLLFFYGMNCSTCWQIIEQAKGFQQLSVVDSVIGFTVGTDSSLRKFENATKLNFRSILVDKKDIRNYVDYLPTIYYIQHDTVFYVQKDNLISPLSFREKILKTGQIYF